MEVLTTVDAGRIAQLRRADRFFWLDLDSPSDADLHRLGELLGLHQLALEDTREMNQPAKADRYDGHVLIVWWTGRACVDHAEHSFEPIEVHVYIAGGYVMTVRRVPLRPLEALHEEIAGKAGAESDVVYRILDVLTDALQPVVDRIGARVDELEEQVLASPRREHVRQIYRLKQDVRELLRRVGTQRERFADTRDAIESIPGLTLGPPQTVNDLRDHLDKAEGDLGRANDDLAALTSTYFNAATERLSTIGTRLSVVATLFLVWTLITSFFGQNFKWMVDHVSSRQDFLVFGVGGLAVSTLLVAAFFWWRRHDLL